MALQARSDPAKVAWCDEVRREHVYLSMDCLTTLQSSVLFPLRSHFRDTYSVYVDG